MNALRTSHPAHQQIADALAWLRERVQPGAHLHADTRSLALGDAFLAYAVDGADNRSFIDNAIKRGAAAVLYQPENFTGQPDPALALAVPALNELAGSIASGWYGDPSDAMRVIGVTGTNGKTSCTQWIAAALSSLGTRCAVIGTLGSGMPGAIGPDRLHDTRRAPIAAQSRAVASRGCAGGGDGSVVACAASGARERHGVRYRGIHEPDAGSSGLPRHVCRIRSHEGASFRVAELRCAVINADDEAGRRLLASTKGRARTIAYALEARVDALSADASLIATNVRATAGGTAFHLSSTWGDAEVEVGTLGAFNVSNLLGVLGALFAADVPFDAALAELAKLEPVHGRMQRLGGRLQNDEPLVVIDYAHTPDALEKTLSALRPIAQARGGELICMFGCGGDRDATKRPLMGAIAERCADGVVVTSDNPRSEDPQKIIDQIAAGMKQPSKARCIEDRASAILQAIRSAAREDVIVLAGKGHEATQEIMGKKRAFSDQDHARLALAARATHARGGGE